MPSEQFNPLLYSGWPDTLRDMASKMLRENMSDGDAAELRIVADVFERALHTVTDFGREIERYKRQVAVLTSVEDPLPSLRMEDEDAFFDPDVFENALGEIFKTPPAQELRSPVTPGIANPEAEKAHRNLMEGFGPALGRKVDAAFMGPRRGLTTEEGQRSENIEARLCSLERVVFNRDHVG